MTTRPYTVQGLDVLRDIVPVRRPDAHVPDDEDVAARLDQPLDGVTNPVPEPMFEPEGRGHISPMDLTVKDFENLLEGQPTFK